ncbi:MAG: BatA domain-containing protein, partial [Bauldia sp.]
MSFAIPAVLFALIALPAIWWLLRVTPPRPKTETFPPTRLLLEIAKKDEEPSKTPWWLILLRIALAALVILALAGPILRPTAEEAPGAGPLLLVMDNGWAAAERFDAMKDTAGAIIDLARDADRPVAFVATAEPAGQAMAPTTADAVAARLATLEPQPHEADATGSIEQLRAVLPAAPAPFGGAVWITDGIGGPDADAVLAFLAETVAGPIAVYADTASDVLGLLPPESTAEALTVPVVRQDANGPPGGRVIARDLRGRVVADATFAFDAGAVTATARFEIPTELRNDIVRLEIAGQETAGAVQLLDERYRRRTVGIINGAPSDQPLLAADYYVTRALLPFADLRVPASGELPEAVNELIAGGVSVIVLADIGTIPTETEAALATWVENGGTLIRFAGPRLAAATPTLIPAPLRLGGRTLGGTLSWETPQPLGEFPRSSPFFGLAVPADVLIEQQVLAEPNAELASRTYASLADGTPLVTGAPRGDGLLVLFHVTADPSWSNLPLSGVFVEMLRRIVALANAATTPAETATGTVATLNPYRILDGYGRFVDAGPATEPIPAGNVAIAIDRSHPPGLYGTEDGFRALSLLEAGATLPQLALSGIEGAALRPYPDAAPVELRPWLLAGALALFLIDALAVLWLNGAFAARRRAAAAAVLLVASAFIPAFPGGGEAIAQEALTPADQMALNAATQTPLAYVITGDQENDDLTLAGLRGLSIVLTQRTSFEPGEPVGLNLD